MKHAAIVAVATLVAAATAPAINAQESHFFTASDGQRIHYLTAGSEGSWVVLLHGYGDSAQRMWLSTGIAQALADNHRVVAIDHLNHGESDRPEPEPRGVGRVSDVLELMDLLGVGRAHIHGYSMGGAMVSTLLYEVPEKFITAGYGGSGVRETDPVLRALAASFDDPEAEDPSTIVRAAIAPQAEAPAGGRGGGPGGGLSSFARPLDLTTVDIPVIAINGELDSPYGKTMRMWRELEVFENVVLPGLNHFTAIAVGEPMPQRYVDSMVGFIDKYDEM